MTRNLPALPGVWRDQWMKKRLTQALPTPTLSVALPRKEAHRHSRVGNGLDYSRTKRPWPSGRARVEGVRTAALSSLLVQSPPAAGEFCQGLTNSNRSFFLLSFSADARFLVFSISS